MPKIQKKLPVSSNALDEKGQQLDDKNTPTLIKHTPEQWLEILTKGISDNNALELQKLLSDDYIYPGNGLKEGHRSKKDGDFLDFNNYSYFGITQPRHNQLHQVSDYKSVYQGDHHTDTTEYEFYYTRPILETLYLEHEEFFMKLLARLIIKDSPALYTTFIEAINKSNEIPRHLLTPCNETTKAQLVTGINAIAAYGAHLTASQIERGKHATALSNELTYALKFMPLGIADPNKAKINALYFKLQFLKGLHSKDEYFANHRREWAPLIANIASFLFTGMLLNIVNYCMTGNFLFYNQTKTRSLVSDTHKALTMEQSALKM